MARDSVQRTQQRFALVALAIVGTLIGHSIAYSVRPGAAGGHGYVGWAATIAVPLGLCGLLQLALATARRLDVGQRSFRNLFAHLAFAQIVLFLGQETFEQLAAASGPFDSRPLLIGVAAQVAVAFVSSVLVGLAREVALALTATSRRRAGDGPLLETARTGTSFVAFLRPASHWQRGPPGVVTPNT